MYNWIGRLGESHRTMYAHDVCIIIIVIVFKKLKNLLHKQLQFVGTVAEGGGGANLLKIK